MDYRSIIQDNRDNHSKIKWWPNYAYHYTDISNAVSILKCERLYSRTNAKKLRLMNNDNASKKVIDITNSAIIDKVRLYFRPLTPTQYYNEGFKHKSIRYNNDEYANVPVPVFFVFNLEKLLSKPGVEFSECSQAGNGYELKNGIKEFSKLNFEKIYSCGYTENLDELKKYRHAEIVCSDSLDISGILHAVVCRNAIEKASLLNMLKNTDVTVYAKYKTLIKVFSENMFQKNGLFVTDVNLFDNRLTFTFCDTYEKEHFKDKQMERNNVDSLTLIKSKLELEWTNTREKLLYKKSVVVDLNYDVKNLVMKIPKVDSAKILHVKLFFEDNLMCDVERYISSSQIL